MPTTQLCVFERDGRRRVGALREEGVYDLTAIAGWSSLDDVLALPLAGIRQTLARSGKTLQVDDEAMELLVSQGYSLAYGARYLKRVIDERIKLPISQSWRDASHFRVRAEDGQVVVQTVPAGLLPAMLPVAYSDVA